jgi:acetyl esterase/lipase
MDKLLLSLVLLAGLVGLAFFILNLFIPNFRSLFINRPTVTSLVLTLSSVISLIFGIIIFTGQPWPMATNYIEKSLWFFIFAFGGTLANISGVIMLSKNKEWSWYIGVGGGILSVVATILTMLPFLQMLASNEQFEADLRKALGNDYTNRIPNSVKDGFRNSYFNLTDYIVGLNTGNYSFKQDLVFRTVGDEKLQLDVFYPTSSNNTASNPTLVVIHGGGFEQGDKSEYSEFNAYLATRGWTVFSINYRLAPKYTYPVPQEDVECALLYIAKNGATYGADINKLVLMGRSAGGNLALSAAYNPNILPTASSCGQQLPSVKAVVAYYPPTDLTDWYNKDTNGRIQPIVARYIGGTPSQKPEEYRFASPINNVGGNLPPTLLIESGRDQLDLSNQSTLLADKLRANGNKVALLYLPWAGHSFDSTFEGISNQPILYFTERFLAYVVAG